MGQPNFAGAVDLGKHASDKAIIQALAADRDTMRIQRNMLGQALGELLVAIGVANPVDMNGPLLISIAHSAIQVLKGEEPTFPLVQFRKDPDRTTGYSPIDMSELEIVDNTDGGLAVEVATHESDQSRYASECDLCETDGDLHAFDCPNNPRNAASESSDG